MSEAIIALASMGPRASARGNEGHLAARAALSVLQWGRAHLRAEIGERSATVEAAKKLQWGRAHLRAEIRSGWRRNSAAVELQWGRAHLRAEI